MNAKWLMAWITCPSRELAQKIAQSLLEQQLIACAQISGPIQSLYTWEGKMHSDEEWRLVLKTTAQVQEQLIAKVLEMHPYQTPQIIFTEVIGGHPEYLKWIQESVVEPIAIPWLKETLALNGAHQSLIVPAPSDHLRDALWKRHGEEPAYFPYWLSKWGGAFALIAHLEPLQAELEGQKILELGCGCGTLAQWTKDWPGEWLFSDLVPEAVEFAKTHGPQKQRSYAVADIWNFEILGSWDKILVADCSYEDALLLGILELAQRILKPHGSLILLESVTVGRDGNHGLIQEKWIGKIQSIQVEYQIQSESRSAHGWELKLES
jgi:periplasmic divalent cation tolerance protein